MGSLKIVRFMGRGLYVYKVVRDMWETLGMDVLLEKAPFFGKMGKWKEGLGKMG